MQINKNFINKLIKIFITIFVLECVYLFVIPFSFNQIAKTDLIKNVIASKTNANIGYSDLKIKTHVIPALSFKAKKFDIVDKESQASFLSAEKVNAKIKLFPLLFKKLDIKHVYSDSLALNIEQDKDGVFNFEKLFPSKKKKSLSLQLNKNKIKINNLNVKFADKQLNDEIEINSLPLIIDVDKKEKKTQFNLKGEINSKNQKTSKFDVKIASSFPFNKSINENLIAGSCFVSNLNLTQLKPFVQKYIDKKSTKFAGVFDYIQLTAEEKNGKNNIILNTNFKNVVYDREGWENYIVAKGDNILNANFSLLDNVIDFNSVKFKADKVNFKTDGSFKFGKKREIDMNFELLNSKAENVVPILPPNLVKRNLMIQKVKSYGVYGDVTAKIHAKGIIPAPDIEGFVKARNVHVLEKDIHHLHKATVDLKFNKRTLDMDILVDAFNNQKITVKGYTYMFREGINHIQIKSTEKVDLPLAKKIVVPVSKIFAFQLGPIPDMDIISGKGILDLDIKNSIDFIDANGYCEFDRARLTYNGIYGEFTNGKGRVDFNGDVISVKTHRAFAKGNFLDVEGKVKINDNLDFNISTPIAKSEDILQIVNNSTLLKDVKAGLVILTKASGPVRLFTNIKANITPVPYGQPPLPPEEAFTDMKVKGSVYLFDDECTIEGFYTPLQKIKGIVDFTETEVNLNNITGFVGTSPVKLTGNILMDAETKIPDIDIEVVSDKVNLKDTIMFLTQSYLYPKEYPDLSFLYNIQSQHDLYFKYKAKAIDFVADKAYAKMNFLPDNTNGGLKAKKGNVVMKDATVTVNDVEADLFGGNLKVDGNVQHIDTVNPIYNLNFVSSNFDLGAFSDNKKITIFPTEVQKVLQQFKNYSGKANIDLSINKNIFNGEVNILKLYMEQLRTSIPFSFDEFSVFIKNNNVFINNMTAQIGDIPLFGTFSANNLSSKPVFNGYFTSKLTNNFIQNHLPKFVSDKFEVVGDVNLTTKFNATLSKLHIEPKLLLNPDSDIRYEKISLGEIGDKREFTGKIDFDKDTINIRNFDYIKYISSQNNRVYPITFATVNGNLIKTSDNLFIPKEISIKTHKNLSARILNLLLKKPFFTQGTLNCDLKYTTDLKTKAGKFIGEIDSKNINVPLFDMSIKNIRIIGNEDAIHLDSFGFIGDSRVSISSAMENELNGKPKINSLNIKMDTLNNNVLIEQLSKTHKAMNKDNAIKNIDLSRLSIKNGTVDIDETIVKDLKAKNLQAKFSIDEDGVLLADTLKLDVGKGKIEGQLSYNLNDSTMSSDFNLNNVDANYVAETLFDAKNQIYGNANGKIYLASKGTTNEEIISNLSGAIYFDMADGKMPKLGSLEYLLRASNIVKGGITGFSLNNILELLNLVKTGHFSNINGQAVIEEGIVKNIEIFSQGDNLSLYIHGDFDILNTHADLEILGNLSKRISTFFGAVGNTSLNSFFKLIPGISMLDFNRKDIVENVEKIPAFTNGKYEAKTFQAIIDGNINESGYVQSFKWVE